MGFHNYETFLMCSFLNSKQASFYEATKSVLPRPNIIKAKKYENVYILYTTTLKYVELQEKHLPSEKYDFHSQIYNNNYNNSHHCCYRLFGNSSFLKYTSYLQFIPNIMKFVNKVIFK